MGAELVNELEEGGGFGKKVWYKCPKCKEDKWALEAFAGTVCWNCQGNPEIAEAANEEMKGIDPEFFDRREHWVTMEENNKPLHPKSRYKYSNFRTLYKQVNIDDVTDNQIIKILQDEAPMLVDTYKSCKFNEIGQKCVMLWTEESPLYRKFTKMLIYDDYSELKKFMPIVRGITSCIVTPSDKARTTWRGSKILIKQFDDIKVGTTYRIPQILATSESESVAQSFIEGDGYMIKFKIPKGSWNAAPIRQWSSLSGEDEVLFPPYTAIKITSKSKYNKLVECEVIDNMAADRNCDSRVL